MRAAPLTRLDWALLGAIGAWGVFWLAPGLAHPGIHDWDEAFHQAAARGTYESFFYPHLWADHLWPEHPKFWWSSQVWLHKPTLPLWLAAAIMKLVGVTPTALRLGSLLGHLLAGGCVYLLGRRLVSPFWAAVGGLAFLSLPFTWRLTQGVMFADVYDAMLAGFVTLALLWLVRAVEQDSARWAALAGMALGLGHLTKTVLALAPFGVACLLAGLRLCKLAPGPRPSHLLAMGGAALLTSGPWNLYCFLRWPEAFKTSALHTFGHVLTDSGVDVGPWQRPVDAVLNELLSTEIGPVPHPLVVLGGIWLLVRAARKRELAVLALALWVWSTWLTHSLMSVKVPAQVWSAAPGAMLGLALLAADAWRSAPLALAALAGAATPKLIEWLPSLSRGLREALPAALQQTRVAPGLSEGALAMAAAALVGYGLYRLARRSGALAFSLGLTSAAALLYTLLVLPPGAIRQERQRHRERMVTEYMREVGRALDRAVPERSILFQAVDREPPGSFELPNLLFWSGRMAFRRPPDLEAAKQRGYHPYLVSPVAEPYAPVAGVPTHAPMRAYDLLAPAPPPPLPEGATPVEAEVGGMTLLGFASGPAVGEQDRWVFFLRPHGVPGALSVTFLTQAGPQPVQLEPEASLRSRGSLADVPWFVLPAYGPRRDQVQALELGSRKLRVAVR